MLKSCGFPHTNLGKCGTSPAGLALELVSRCRKLFTIARKERPDVIASIAGTFAAPVGKLLGIPVVTFYDTEHASVSNLIAYPLSDYLAVPSCYRKTIRSSHITYQGYHELAYLHPNYYTPDPAVLDLLGVKEGEKYVIMRFVSWKAGHDIGHSGLSLAMRRKAVTMFSGYAKVFITSEKELPDNLDSYRLSIPPDKIHDALFYATLLYGESATMASEAAVLGTPAVYIDKTGRGYTDEQENVYGAVFNFTESEGDQELSTSKGVELLACDTAKQEWTVKRNNILSDKVDVTAFVTELVKKAGKR